MLHLVKPMVHSAEQFVFSQSFEWNVGAAGSASVVQLTVQTAHGHCMTAQVGTFGSQHSEHWNTVAAPEV